MRYYVDADKVIDIIYDADIDDTMKTVIAGQIDALKKTIDKVLTESNAIHIDHVDVLNV